jgi:hypothetical protein
MVHVGTLLKIHNHGTLDTSTMTLVTDNPTVDFVSSTFLQIGLELELVDAAIGEFDQDLLGLPRLGEEITMFESLGSAYGYEHKITEWADDRTEMLMVTLQISWFTLHKKEMNCL